MSNCNHMVGLEHTGEDYVPAYKCGRSPDWNNMNAHGCVFSYCPYCGERLPEFKEPPNDRQRRMDRA